MAWYTRIFAAPSDRLERVQHALDGHTTMLIRLEKKMSALSDAIASLTAAEQAEHEELVLVLAGGFTAEDVAAVQAAKAQTDANIKAMADALATPPPTPTAEPPA